MDAIVSPLFYALIGGAPLAMAYRAVNTLDSMVGYKNEKYLHLGWASARLDDWANWIPARLTALLLIMGAWFMKLNARGAASMISRDARLHPSPNSGFPESAVAGRWEYDSVDIMFTMVWLLFAPIWVSRHG